MGRKAIDMTGREFGRLTVVERAGSSPQFARWKCKCVCGNEIVTTSNNLRLGHTKSCGCLFKESVALMPRIRSNRERLAETHQPGRILLLCENCGKGFDTAKSDRVRNHIYCSLRCASLARERALGHQPAIVAKCSLESCHVEVRRYVSKNVSQTTTVPTGNVFCCRRHYLEWRHGKESKI